MGLSDKLDQELLDGTGGLFTGTTLADHASGSAQTTYAQYRSQLLFSRIDGRYANGVGEIRILMGSDSYAHAAAQYRGNNDNMDALMSLISQSGGVRVSGPRSRYRCHQTGSVGAVGDAARLRTAGLGFCRNHP